VNVRCPLSLSIVKSERLRTAQTGFEAPADTLIPVHDKFERLTLDIPLSETSADSRTASTFR
jgi:hypothetical protein